MNYFDCRLGEKVLATKMIEDKENYSKNICSVKNIISCELRVYFGVIV